MIYVGIDPGAKGAIVTINRDGELLEKSMFEGWHMAQIFIDGIRDEEGVLAGIEKVHTAAGTGVKSIFSFGMNYGGWIAILESNDIPYVQVSPQSWQPKILGAFAKGESKKAANDYISKRYPTLNLMKKEQGIADAICIALYTSKFK